MATKSNQITIILNGTLIDGSGEEAITNKAIVISGNRIQSVGKLPEDINLEDLEKNADP